VEKRPDPEEWQARYAVVVEKRADPEESRGKKTVIIEISPIWEISTITVFYLKL